ncbi:aspartate aminotransferase family protein [Lentibacillus sediminis]|uniref:aspartate aminotransferase family protein n=1 Tax=Lentibacillus sediminis TaxID=1940529 RepID=UPI001EFC58FC|nr:aminotransferase class III-fold pyridoxal phosphate-dependent enzyme [Lentibacillus sediminis]
MPWGSGTCSKAPRLLPEEPGVIVKGKGCRVRDADGREFIDFRNGLGPITLGYQFPDVDAAIQDQLSSGILYGHPHPLECEVAEMLCEVVPGAEQARFLKTGGEAIAACIRMARHYTGKEHIIQIGYNGWLNGLASGGQTLPGQTAMSSIPGVPSSISALHHTAIWNDISGLEQLFVQYHDQIAAVVISADYADMDSGKAFYPALRELTRKHNSLLIFDEIVTGFRIALGGVQQYFNVKPDLSVFGKGMANGMPVSVYAGKKEVMAACEKGGVTISSTFAGETLSLAAAKATLLTYRNKGVVNHLWRQGEKMWSGMNELFTTYDIPIEMKGFWPCIAFTVKSGADKEIKNQFFRAAYNNGISLYDVSYVNFSHKDRDVEEALQRLEQACKALSA